MLEENPDFLNAAYAWSETDHESAIQGAAQVGSVPVATYLLERGAPLEISTAAMLGRREEVEKRIREDLKNINSTGAHGIPLLTHAAWSGDLELVQYLFRNGATTGSSSALQNAVTRGYYDLVVWLIENASPDLNAKNFQGKTPLSLAIERKQETIAQLLKDRQRIVRPDNLNRCPPSSSSAQVRGQTNQLKPREPVQGGQRRPSCSKHGPYDGPYCPECYGRAMNGEATSKTAPSS